VNSNDLTDDDYDRVGRFLAGELTASERSEFSAWVEADRSRRTVVEEARKAWQASAVVSSVPAVDSAWSKLKNRIELDRGSGVIEIASKRPWWRNSGLILRVAAVAAVVAGTSVVWERATSEAESTSTLAATAGVVHVTRPAERRSVTLADGSQVELGVASTLTVSADYGAPLRQVSLTGEAFFTIEHDSTRPFRVIANGAVVEDLGTEFSIRSYGPDSSTLVAVTSGSVSVQPSNATPVVLQPRDVATVRVAAGTDQGVSVQRDVDVSRYLGFRNGQLIFENTPMSGVFRALERWFDVEFRVTDRALLERTLNVPFEPNASLETVLEVIETTLGITLERTGRVIEVAAPPRTGMSSGSREQVGGGA
jgi:ferric-dicitrate binding protein FerR (iron transport regulator)